MTNIIPKKLSEDAGYESLRHDELKLLLPNAHWLLDLEKHFYGGKGVKPYPEIGDFTRLLADIRDVASTIAALQNPERDKALVEAAFTAGATQMARFGSGQESNPEPDVANIIAQVDKELAKSVDEGLEVKDGDT